MPEEFSRTTARKRITLGSSFVDVPVITKISFIDPIRQYQEYQYSVDNSAAGDRQVHVDTVTALDPSISIDVERIETWSYIDPINRYQETQVAFDNTTKSESPPPYFTTHLTTHIVRYTNPNDRNAWIESELIDSFSIIDPIQQYQEFVYTLNNPTTNEEAQANPEDPDISDSENGIDGPWRTDPFQNIVRISGASPSTGGTWLVMGSPGPQRLQAFPGIASGDGPFAMPTALLVDPTAPPAWPPNFANPRDDVFIQYAAGTLYCKESDFVASISQTGTRASFYGWPFWGLAPPSTDIGPPMELFPEISAEANSQAIAMDTASLTHLVGWPFWRYFVVRDDEWDTSMSGVHDYVPPPG